MDKSVHEFRVLCGPVLDRVRRSIVARLAHQANHFLLYFAALWLALAVLHFAQVQRGLDFTNKIAIALGVAFQAWLLLAATACIPPLPSWSSLGLGLAIIVLCELMAPSLSPSLSRRDVYAFYTCPLVMQLFVGRP